MGMSTHVIGFKPPDERWQQMKTIYDACDAAGIPLPDEVERFFDDGPPDPNGVEVDEDKLEELGAVREWSDGSREGYEVIVDKLPKDVKIVRVYNSW